MPRTHDELKKKRGDAGECYSSWAVVGRALVMGVANNKRNVLFPFYRHEQVLTTDNCNVWMYPCSSAVTVAQWLSAQTA
ncbi:hypothetical protein Q5P01_024642 [Channa striata]|uniref:Uncharacterized protein n=1 Tax=Channa striata TaxID=64152 RepID=A0AA88IQU7_CHASR|nr:hypothetical protein Q5P01_024642 [Channa striata]